MKVLITQSIALLFCFGFVSQTVEAQSQTFGFEFFGDRLFSCPVDDLPTQTDLLVPTTYTTLAMDFNTAGNTLYAIDRTLTSNRQFGTIDTTDGSFSPIAPLGGEFDTSTNESGLSFDPTDDTAFLSTPTTLYTIDVTTVAATLIGDFAEGGSSIGSVIDIAFDNSGQLFAHSITTDALYSVDKTTGSSSFIGAHGLNATAAQGMDFDSATNTLYAAIYTGGASVGSYRTWNTTTGEFTELTSLATLPEPIEMEMAILAISSGDCVNPLGDVNGDGVVTLLDVGPFVDAISTNVFVFEADVNADGVVDLLDVGPFVDLLSGG